MKHLAAALVGPALAVSLSACGATTGSLAPSSSASAPAASSQPSAWHVVLTVAGVTSGPGCGITGVAVDQQGTFYFAELCDDRIEKFSSGGQLLAQWGAHGSGPGQLDQPAKVAVDVQGNVYVTELGNGRVQKFSPTGKPLAQWGSKGSGPGQFDWPVGIALDHQGNSYVVDLHNDRIQKLSPLGRLLAQWGTAGSGPGQFNVPYDIALDAAGNFYVSDTAPPGGPGNHRIQKFSPGGEPLAQWGTFGSGPGEFDGLRGLLVDSQGYIYAEDTGNNRIQKLSPKGQYLGEWSGPGAGLGRLSGHSEMAMDGLGNVYVSSRNRLMKLVVG